MNNISSHITRTLAICVPIVTFTASIQSTFLTYRSYKDHKFDEMKEMIKDSANHSYYNTIVPEIIKIEPVPKNIPDQLRQDAVEEAVKYFEENYDYKISSGRLRRYTNSELIEMHINMRQHLEYNPENKNMGIKNMEIKNPEIMENRNMEIKNPENKNRRTKN